MTTTSTVILLVIPGKGNAALGLSNDLKGEGNLVAGVGNSINGKGNLVAGQGNIVIGPDATEEEKALMNQKMLEMFASRGLGGIFGMGVAQQQTSSNPNAGQKESAPASSGSKAEEK